MQLDAAAEEERPTSASSQLQLDDAFTALMLISPEVIQGS